MEDLSQTKEEMMGEKRIAYVSIVCSRNYLVGLVATYLSLKDTGTSIPMYVLLPKSLVVECEDQVRNIVRIGINIIEYEESVLIPQELIDNNQKTGDNRFSHTFDKLLVFELVQFEKIVFIDSDIFILQNLDKLFRMPHMSAMVAGRSFPGNEDWVDLTSGIMTIVPQMGLLAQFKKAIPNVVVSKTTFGDQDVIQYVYPDWSKQPELNMGEKYGIMSGYAYYYEECLGYNYSDDIDDPRSVAVLHFAGEKKPWMQSWSWLSIIKQELLLICYKLIHKRSTRCVLLEYNHLVRKAKKILG